MQYLLFCLNEFCFCYLIEKLIMSTLPVEQWALLQTILNLLENYFFSMQLLLIHTALFSSDGTAVPPSVNILITNNNPLSWFCFRVKIVWYAYVYETSTDKLYKNNEAFGKNETLHGLCKHVLVSPRCRALLFLPFKIPLSSFRLIYI